MSADDLERELEQLDEGGGPREGWQERVLERIDTPPAPRRPHWALVLGGTGLVAAATATLLVIMLRGPEPRRPAGPAAVEPRPAGAAKMDRVDRLNQAVEKVLHAKTERERAAAEARLEQLTRELEAMQETLLKSRAAWPKLDDGKITVKCDPNDPLCGLE